MSSGLGIFMLTVWRSDEWRIGWVVGAGAGWDLVSISLVASVKALDSSERSYLMRSNEVVE